MHWLLFGFVSLLAACGSEGNPLANTEWRLVALGNADAPADAVLGGNPNCRVHHGCGYDRVDGLQFLRCEIQRREVGAAP